MAGKKPLCCGGDGDYGDGGKGGVGRWGPGSLIAPHHRHPTQTSALEPRGTLTVIVASPRWKALLSHDAVGWRQLRSHAGVCTCTPNT